MSLLPTSQIDQLETLRGSRVLVYYGDANRIDDADVEILYDALWRIGRTERLDFVLHTRGGSVNVARQIALLLHEFTDHLAVLVPYRAWSAGTIVCLAAQQLLLGPLAQLGPIDPIIASVGETVQGSPAYLSSEDIRTFRHMAEKWFGMTTPEQQTQVFAALVQRIFPTTLTSFYRSDRQIRKIGRELLRYQLPGVDNEGLDQIIEHLVTGIDAHDYRITRSEARDLGLCVEYPASDEAALMWGILRECKDYIETQSVQGITANGIIVTSDLQAHHIMVPREMPTSTMLPSDKMPRATFMMQSRWEIIHSQ
jgi:hypothetical protein